MKHLRITTSIDQPELLEDMVEKLACRRTDSDFAAGKLGDDYQLVDTSSVEKYLSGNIGMEIPGEGMIQVPFITSMVFSCTREKFDPYRLNWSMSLS